MKAFGHVFALYGWVSVPRFEPLLADLILLAQKLERIGFTYYNDKGIRPKIPGNLSVAY